MGLEPGLDRLSGLVGRVLAEAGLSGTGGPRLPVRRARGVLPGGDGPAVRRAAPRGGVPARRLAGETLLFNDTFAALRAGTADGWGVAVICGSGMNAVGRAPDGRVARFAGLGEIAGDRGGGSGLGMWGLGAAVRADDGRGPATQPLDARARALRPQDAGRRDRGALLRPDRGPAGGELAPVVAQAARDGDAVAQGLVDDIADELAAFATASIRRLSLEEEPVPVTLAGGLARGAADLLVPRVTDLVRADRAGRRDQRAPRAAGARRRAARARPPGAGRPRRGAIGCERRSAPGTTRSGRRPPRP